MGNYTVYMHIPPSGKRYVGITIQNAKKRWMNGWGYHAQPYFYRSILKYGWDEFEHKILFENLTKEEAEQKEIQLISFYRSNNREYGYNIANGGNCIGTCSEETKKKTSEALKGREFSEETRKKLSKALKGKKYSLETIEKLREFHLGKILPVEQRNKISAANKGKKKSKEQIENLIKINTGSKRSLESRKKMSDAKKGKYLGAKSPSAKPVIQFDLNGNYLRKFGCVKEAEAFLGMGRTHISCCCNGKLKSSCGFIWKFADFEDISG